MFLEAGGRATPTLRIVLRPYGKTVQMVGLTDIKSGDPDFKLKAGDAYRIHAQNGW